MLDEIHAADVMTTIDELHTQVLALSTVVMALASAVMATPAMKARWHDYLEAHARQLEHAGLTDLRSTAAAVAVAHEIRSFIMPDDEPAGQAA